MRLNLLSDVIDRLRKLGHLSNTCPSNNQLLDPESVSYKTLRDAQLFDTIDFIRAVHAEASAMFSAGVGTRGSTKTPLARSAPLAVTVYFPWSLRSMK